MSGDFLLIEGPRTTDVFTRTSREEIRIGCGSVSYRPLRETRILCYGHCPKRNENFTCIVDGFYNWLTTFTGDFNVDDDYSSSVIKILQYRTSGNFCSQIGSSGAIFIHHLRLCEPILTIFAPRRTQIQDDDGECPQGRRGQILESGSFLWHLVDSPFTPVLSLPTPFPSNRLSYLLRTHVPPPVSLGGGEWHVRTVTSCTTRRRGERRGAGCKPTSVTSRDLSRGVVWDKTRHRQENEMLNPQIDDQDSLFFSILGCPSFGR